ncbi:MAG: nucleoside phosphorylase [Clostridiaceae bacterium]|nr:nucleoside phosphorylase [Clostridiaceae bacterium]
MALVPHEFPILEYDTDQRAVIQPGSREIAYPEKAVFLFLGDETERYAAEHACEKLEDYVTITKVYPIFKTVYQGEEICFCQAPLGAPAAVQILDHLIGSGVRKIIAAGSCGALVDIAENEFLLPVEAIRDEGTSYHYLPPARTITLDAAAVDAVRRTLTAHGLGVRECCVWTTDAFYRETAEMVTRRRAEGCTAVDMECAAMAACARFRGALFGQLLFTADSLADIEAHDERDWGMGAFGKALELAFDAIARL